MEEVAGSERAKRTRFGSALVMAAAMGGMASPTDASGTWQEGGGAAVAILPVPSNAKAIVGGSLSCSEQRWTLMLRTESGSVPAGTEAQVRLVVGDAIFEAQATEASGVLRVGIAKAMLEPLRTGARLGVSVGEKGSIAKAIFSLAGSRNVLDTIRPRCSPVDMAGYNLVSLSETNPGVEAAAALMAEEAREFREATGKAPVVAAALVDGAEGRQLLFASLCGSTAYYGPSGCTLSGFARQGTAGDWREVYNTDGVALYVDPAGSQDGWPNLGTLPADGDDPLHWSWDGNAYARAGSEVAQDITATDDAAASGSH